MIAIKILTWAFVLFAISVLIKASRLIRRTENWRKNINIGDKCRFRNISNEWTICTVKDIQNDSIYIKSEGPYGFGLQWMSKNNLYPVK